MISVSIKVPFFLRESIIFIFSNSMLKHHTTITAEETENGEKQLFSAHRVFTQKGVANDFDNKI